MHRLNCFCAILFFPSTGVAAKVVVNVVPAAVQDNVDVTALPIGIDDATAGHIVEILAMMHVRIQADGGGGECKLPPIDVFLWKHTFDCLTTNIHNILCKNNAQAEYVLNYF